MATFPSITETQDEATELELVEPRPSACPLYLAIVSRTSIFGLTTSRSYQFVTRVQAEAFCWYACATVGDIENVTVDLLLPGQDTPQTVRAVGRDYWATVESIRRFARSDADHDADAHNVLLYPVPTRNAPTQEELDAVELPF